MSATATFPGTVVKATGSWFQVRLDDGTERACRLRGQLRLKGSKSTSFVAVGDRVELEDEGAEQAVIIALHDRKNYILRKSVNLSHKTQVIAANLDQAVLVTTVAEPKTLFGFIDRFLATAEAYSVPAVLVFNKMDALSGADRDELEYREAAYGAAGYRTLRTSAHTGEGLEELRSLLANKVTLFSGHSGVGKSSLANALDPSLSLRTQAVSTAHGQGQHTTTFAEMHRMAGNIDLIDTPGIRGFGIVSMEASEIGDYFPEIFALRSQCRFADCSHTEEPGCAVRDAVEAHTLAPTRYRSYLSMLHGVDDDDPYRQDAYKI
jgi:ribosome biogenesis GTPase